MMRRRHPLYDDIGLPATRPPFIRESVWRLLQCRSGGMSRREAALACPDISFDRIAQIEMHVARQLQNPAAAMEGHVAAQEVREARHTLRILEEEVRALRRRLRALTVECEQLKQRIGS